ncbi:hypothetical protein N0V93_009024 [Gnomoniopsis smithogilvyi]|uniref:Tyrosine specific protein phosphatases domain-containing protein n=1 Tax=Gnomoniopsis smithogilvyi TaxID=1191159 RepID=A0A9W8YJ70_9PEZI|nr:hypothetical protein N0V93_009024 [Gnomoniopsis smithogilvyi]
MASPPTTATTTSTTTTTSTPSLPCPPFIDVPGLRNFRDAGGYPLEDAPTKIVRKGLLFRASEPSKVTDQGIATMTDTLGIKRVYDLRSQTELDRDAKSAGRQVKEWAGSERVFAPVFSNEDYSPEAIAKRFSAFASEGSEGFVQVYTRILLAGASPNGPFALILRHLASPDPPAPILIHCTAGKDRTGVIIALILSLCGVSDEAVAHEYSLTDLGLGERKEEFISHLISVEPLKGNRAAAERMVSSRAESMQGTLKMIRERWGGGGGVYSGGGWIECRRGGGYQAESGGGGYGWIRNAEMGGAC